MEWAMMKVSNNLIAREATGRSGIHYAIYNCINDGSWVENRRYAADEVLSYSAHHATFAEAQKSAEDNEAFELFTRDLESLARRHEGEDAFIDLRTNDLARVYRGSGGQPVATIVRLAPDVWQYRPAARELGNTKRMEGSL